MSAIMTWNIRGCNLLYNIVKYVCVYVYVCKLGPKHVQQEFVVIP